MTRILVFGAGSNAKIFTEYIKTKNDYQIVGYIDNNCNMTEKNLGGGWMVKSPAEICNFEYDKIVVTVSSKVARDEIRRQLIKLQVPQEKCIFLLEDDELKLKVFSYHNRYDESDCRVNWVKAYSKYVYSENIKGNVAECGVNRGEFAYYINKFFYDRQCYLFDTFEGFAQEDLKEERAIGDEAFLNGDFNKDEQFLCTSVEVVKRRLVNPDLCRFFVGYFPKSAATVQDEFCFVNLDMDLYKPMLEGLKFFYPKMTHGGVILLHDYFHPELPGVKKAVKDFEEYVGETLHKMPIGDYCSIAVLR